MPSSSSSGKKNRPCRRVNQALKPRRVAALSSSKEKVSISMSGSLPILFGFPW